ncbi:unnamed protein product, partial [Ectocarpus sp. 12 AP-2014]
ERQASWRTTSVFSSSSTSRARRMVRSDTQLKRTAVDQSSRDGGVSSRGARRNAGQYKETFGQGDRTCARRWRRHTNVGWPGQTLPPREDTASNER